MRIFGRRRRWREGAIYRFGLPVVCFIMLWVVAEMVPAAVVAEAEQAEATGRVYDAQLRASGGLDPERPADEPVVESPLLER